MTHQPIVRALIEAITFLGFSGEDAVNEDAAIAQLEEIAAILRELDDEGRLELIRCTQEMAAQEQATAGGSERSTFIKSIPWNLGILMDD